MNFINKNVFINGGTSGIGKECVYEFAKLGANIIFLGRREELGNIIINEISNSGKLCKFLKCDITNENQLKEAFQYISNEFGSLDIAINTAGIEGEWKKIEDINTNELFDIINVNLIGTFNCIKNELINMKTCNKKPKSIVNVSSISGLIGFENGCHYIASKHAINGITKCAALENARNDIRVNAICPGAVSTEMLDRFLPNKKSQEDFAKKHPIGRISSSYEIVNVIKFLASDSSSFITGQCIAVDGGYTVK